MQGVTLVLQVMKKKNYCLKEITYPEKTSVRKNKKIQKYYEKEDTLPEDTSDRSIKVSTLSTCKNYVSVQK